MLLLPYLPTYRVYGYLHNTYTKAGGVQRVGQVGGKVSSAILWVFMLQHKYLQYASTYLAPYLPYPYSHGTLDRLLPYVGMHAVGCCRGCSVTETYVPQ